MLFRGERTRLSVRRLLAGALCVLPLLAWAEWQADTAAKIVRDLSVNLEELAAAAKLEAAALADALKISTDVATAQEKYVTQAARLTELLRAGKLTQSDYNRALSKLIATTRDFSSR